MHLGAENIVQLLLAFQCAFFFMLAMRRSRLRPFALLLLAFALHMVSNLFAETDLLPKAYNFTSSFGFLYGPLFLLSLREMTSSDSTMDRYTGFHLLPFFVSLFFPVGSQVLEVGIALSLFLYATLIARYILRYRQALENTVTDIAVARIGWLNKAAVAFGVLAIFDGVRLNFSTWIPIGYQSQYLVTLIGVFLIVNWLIFKILLFPDLFWGLSEQEFAQSTQLPLNESEPLTHMEKNDLECAVMYFEKQALFLKPHLRLFDFADAIGIEGRELSKLIRRSTGDGFAAFVNRRRIEHAKALIKKAGPDANFLKIAFDAGFNSKSAFNAAFKKFSGKTPSQYRHEGD